MAPARDMAAGWKPDAEEARPESMSRAVLEYMIDADFERVRM